MKRTEAKALLEKVVAINKERGDEERKKALASLGLSKIHKLKTFRTGCTASTKEQKEKFNQCYEYAISFKTNISLPKNIILTGRVGTGKTQMMYNIGHEIIKNLDWSVKICDSKGLMERFSNSFSSDATSAEEIINTLCKISLLVLDDLRVTTIYQTDALLRLIDARYTAGIPTGITTSLSIKRLEEVIGQASLTDYMKKSYCY